MPAYSHISQQAAEATDWKRGTQGDGADQLQEGTSVRTTHTSSGLRPPILKMGMVIPAQPQSAVHKHDEHSATCSPVSNGGGRGWDTNAARGGSFQIRLHFVLLKNFFSLSGKRLQFSFTLLLNKIRSRRCCVAFPDFYLNSDCFVQLHRQGFSGRRPPVNPPVTKGLAIPSPLPPALLSLTFLLFPLVTTYCAHAPKSLPAGPLAQEEASSQQ